MTCGACAKARSVLPRPVRERLELIEQRRIERKKARKRAKPQPAQSKVL
jgi:hypothetical protein